MQTNGLAKNFPSTFTESQEGTVIQYNRNSQDSNLLPSDMRQTSAFNATTEQSKTRERDNSGNKSNRSIIDENTQEVMQTSLERYLAANVKS